MNLNAKKWFHMATAALGVLTLSVAFAPSAHAGCGNMPGSVGALNANLLSFTKSASAPANAASAPQPGGSDIVGMWEVELTATNIPNTPPEGVVIDHGYSQWHSDGTEIMNSSRPPVTGNFCLGVWKKTGQSSYALNHRALSFNPDGTPEGPAILHEDVVIDRSGNTFSGTFTIDQFDTFGNLKAHLVGVITGTRITPD